MAHRVKRKISKKWLVASYQTNDNAIAVHLFRIQKYVQLNAGSSSLPAQLASSTEAKISTNSYYDHSTGAL